MLLNHQWVNEEVKREIRKYLTTNENGNTTGQNMGVSKCSSKREVHSDVYHKKQENLK